MGCRSPHFYHVRLNLANDVPRTRIEVSPLIEGEYGPRKRVGKAENLLLLPRSSLHRARVTGARLPARAPEPGSRSYYLMF